MRRLQKSGMMGEKLLSASRKNIEEDCYSHFHDFYEIEYTVAGEGSCTVNGKEESMQEGLLCFLTPIDCHSVCSTGAEVYNIMFSEQLVPFSLLEPFMGFGAPKAMVIGAETRPFVEQLCAEIVRNEADADYCAMLMACLLRKMAQVFPLPEGCGPKGTLQQILSYVISNYRKRITLSSAASHVGLTPSYVSAFFKKEMRMGFKQYLNSLRLEYAKKLIISTEQSVRQICEDSGFDDIPNFVKRFKAYFGETPTQMRKRWKIAANQ